MSRGKALGMFFKKIPAAGRAQRRTPTGPTINITNTALESPFGPNSNGSQGSNSWKIDSLSL